MKKILITLFAAAVVAIAHGQSISNVQTYVQSESPYNDPGTVWYANDTIYFSVTVHFPSYGELDLNNDELYADTYLLDWDHGQYANWYIVAEAGEPFTVGTIPYGTTKTYTGAYYVGNITTTTDMEVSFSTSFSTSTTIISGYGLIDFTYNP